MVSDTDFKSFRVSDDDADPDGVVLGDDALPEAIDPLEEEEGMGWGSKEGSADDDME